ncbi:MAG: DUF1002 domain-containing protein [Enterococcus sp.]
MKKKSMALVATLLISPALLGTTVALADETSMDQLQVNAVALGNALTQKQEEYTLDKLGIQGETPIYTTDGTDLMNYLPDKGFTSDWAVYSSVRMQTLADGEGITVDIATPDNITKITEEQYQNAAATAGITDAKLTVASAVPIDGSGALAGVYKIVEESGGVINQDRVDVAQDEMDVLSTITEENQGKDGYSDEALNAAQEQAKSELAAQTEEGVNLTQEEIQATVEQALKDNGLDNIVTSDQVGELTTLMSDMKENNIFEDFANEIDLTEAKQQIEETSQGLWESIKNFFTGIWDSITGGSEDSTDTSQ